MVETYKAEYSYYRADEGLHDPILPNSEEFSLLEEHWNDDSRESYLCIAEDEYGTPQAYSFNASPFLNVGDLPKHPATEGACYYREREYKAYRNFLVSDSNAILPEGSGFSKFWDRVTGDRITHIADTNENGIPDSGDTGLTRWGERVDDIQLTSPITEYDEVESIYGHEINGVPRKGSFQGEDTFALAMHVLIPPDDGSVYDVRHFDSDSGEALAVAVGNSSTEYLDAQYEAAGEMGAAISDNPVIAGAATVGLIAASLHPYGRAAVTGLAYLGSVGGAMYMVYDRVIGVYNYAAGKAKDVVMGAHDFDCMLWMAGAFAFKGMTVTEAIQAPVKVLEAYNATMVGGLRILMSRGGSGMTPALVYAGGGIATDAEVAVAATSIFPKGSALADLFPAAMAMSAEGTVSIDAGNGGRKFIDAKNFPKRATGANWKSGKAGKAEKNIRKLLDDAAEHYLDEAVETSMAVEVESVGNEMSIIAKAKTDAAKTRFDRAMADIDRSQEMMETLKEIHRHAPDDLRSIIEVGLESMGRDIEKTAWQMSPQDRARYAEQMLRSLRGHLNEVIDIAEGTYKAADGGEIILFLTDKVRKVKVNGFELKVPNEISVHSSALKSASKKGLMEKYLPEAIKFLQNGADTNGSTGASVRWSLKGHPNIGEVRFMGPGKRVYFSKKVGDGKIHILECGKKGKKSMQDRDIAKAQERFDALINRFEAGVSLYD